MRPVIDLGVAGTTAFITGAGQGLGRAIGVAFAEQGANVVFGCHRSGEGAEAAAALAQAGGVGSVAVALGLARAIDAVMAPSVSPP